MVYNFLIHHSHFVRLKGGISADTSVLSGIQWHSAGIPTLLIMIADIDKDVFESNLISFADDTRNYTTIHDITDNNYYITILTMYMIGQLLKHV